MTTNVTYRKAIQDWVERHACDWIGWYSVSLTMRQSLTAKSSDRTGTFRFNVDESIASQNMRHFLNRMDKSVLGSSGQRYGKRLGAVPCYEYDDNNRLHYHLLLKVPNHITETRLHYSILANWMKTKWGLWQIDCQETYSSGWLRYITKETTMDFANIDFFNTTLTS